MLNREIFRFCQDTMQFGGLQITPSVITPSKSMLEAILSFLIPRTLTDARSWFRLVNQVARPSHAVFRDLVKRDSYFVWDKSLEDAFKHSKKVIINLSKKRDLDIQKKKSSNLPRRRLEQRGNGLPTAAKILHVHD